MSVDAENLVRRFYRELWNEWRLDLADELLTEDVFFRGSLGSTTIGRAAFRRYAESVRRAFPDWHNELNELFSASDRVVARLTWTGTHQGELQGIAPTGKQVAYIGVGLFQVTDAQIAEGWVVGDTQHLWRTLGRSPDLEVLEEPTRT